MEQNFSEIKTRLFEYCLQAVEQRITTAQEAIAAASAAANEETKSSAGDKYETTRAMMHLEQEKNEVQLAKAIQLKNELLAMGSDKICTKAEPGSLVVTDQGTYYLAGGLGKIALDGKVYYSVSIEAPVGVALNGKSAGEIASFQGKAIQVKAVF